MSELGQQRHRARERALEILYEAMIKERAVDEILNDLAITPDAYTVQLVMSTETHRDEAEALIEEFAQDWTLERLAVVDLTIGSVVIPSAIRDEQHQRATRALPDERMIRIRYVPPSMGHLPQVSIADLDSNPSLASQFAGKVVFAGVTDQTAVQDRWMTPYSNGIAMPGVEFHANAFETMARRMFLVDAPPVAVILDEAVELAKTFSTDSSASFVNGVLASCASRLAKL